MKYTIKENNTFGKKLIDVVLANRNLTRDTVDKLLNPTVDFLENPYKIKNLLKGIELFISELDKESVIGLLVDPDVDGSTANALMYQFLVNECNYNKDKIRIFYHENKEHGLNDEKVLKAIKKSDVEFMIVADAGTNDIKEIKDLLKLGRRILVLDHHIMEDATQNTIFHNQNQELIGVIVNNHLDIYSNALSGVGVVYKMLTAMTGYPLPHYLDLVAIGNIADSMDINNLELRYLVHNGLNNITNGLFKEYVTEEMGNSLTPTDVSFNIANKINAVHRCGKQEEKIDLFRALIGEVDDREYKPRKSAKNPNPQVEIHSLQKTMARISGNVKTRQDKSVKTSLSNISTYIRENQCDSNKVIIILNDNKEKDFIHKNVGGLVANKLAEIYQRPVMILHKNKTEYSGSMRGYGTEDFKSILESTDIIRTIGHANASGTFVNISDIPRLQKRVNLAMEEIELVSEGQLVDCEIDLDNMTTEDFDNICDLMPIWFSDCKEPTFLLKNITVNTKDIQNPFATLITFKYGKYKFEKNFASGLWINRVLHKNEIKFGRADLKCDIIVKLKKNEYNKNGYFEIVDMETTIVSDSKPTKPTKNCPF